MKKNKILGIIGGLSIAVAGVAAVVGGLSNKEVEVKAEDTATVGIFFNKPTSGYDGAWNNKIEIWCAGIEQDLTMDYKFDNENGEAIFYKAVPVNAGTLYIKGYKDGASPDQLLPIETPETDTGYYLTGGNYGYRTYGTYTPSYLSAGKVLYLDLSKHTAWENDGATFSCTYYQHNSSFTEITGTKVNGTDNKHLYEFPIPSNNSLWFKTLEFNRKNSGGTENWNKSAKIHYSDKNVYSITGWGSSNVCPGDWNSDVISDANRADIYGDYFLSEVVCDPSKFPTNPGYLSAAWTNVKNEYNNMGTGAQGEFWKAAASETGASREKAAARYDEVIAKYGTTNYENFVNRATSDARINVITPFVEANTATWIIVAVSLAGLTAIGGFFYYKKRKEN